MFDRLCKNFFQLIYKFLLPKINGNQLTYVIGNRNKILKIFFGFFYININ